MSIHVIRILRTEGQFQADNRSIFGRKGLLRSHQVYDKKKVFLRAAIIAL